MPPTRRTHKARFNCPSRFSCDICGRSCRSQGGLTQHTNSKHVTDAAPQNQSTSYTIRHPILSAAPCDINGNFLPRNIPPPPPPEPQTPNDWGSYEGRLQFELSDLLFRRAEMSNRNVDDLLDLWAASLGKKAPFSDHKDLNEAIDSIQNGSAPWYTFDVEYDGEKPQERVPKWMTEKFEVWHRDPHEVIKNLLGNTAFDGHFDYSPYREYRSNKRRWSDFMSGNWSWEQADVIAQNPITHGSMMVPVILGSDKTTVSVGTGHNEFYPLYMSIGNVSNHIRRAHKNAVVCIGFLAIPNAAKEHQDSAQFRKFRRQLFHSSLRFILEPLRKGMTTPEVMKCPDGHFRRVVIELGPFIADYPEQVLVASIVTDWCGRCTAKRWNLGGYRFERTKKWTKELRDGVNGGVLWDDYGIVPYVQPFTDFFPRANINQLLAPDILHQLIKGVFKDHLVAWVTEYLMIKHKSETKVAQILSDIDRRISIAPPYPGLRRFKDGRNFKQWTGNDSKALMKIYLTAIEGHVPEKMVRTFAAYNDFCYLIRRDSINEDDLDAIEDALARFHENRKIFQETGVREPGPAGFLLPRQHAITHYPYLITAFGSPNGLCTSITENKHISAVKQPYRRSSRYKALGQILKTNQRLDKLAACRVDFERRGMLKGSILDRSLAKVGRIIEGGDGINEEENMYSDEDSDDREQVADSRLRRQYPTQAEEEDEDCGPVEGDKVLNHVVLPKIKAPGYPKDFGELAERIDFDIVPYIRRFLYTQLNPDIEIQASDVPLEICPELSGYPSVFHAAVATYYAPSDISGVGGMHREWIRATPSWSKGGGYPRYDCVLVENDPELDGFRGLLVARARLFFSFVHEAIKYPCALVEWYETVGDEPDEDTGLWRVKPRVFAHNGTKIASVIHLDTILRGVQLLPVFDRRFIPIDLEFWETLDIFSRFYVNKYTDHHCFEII